MFQFYSLPSANIFTPFQAWVVGRSFIQRELHRLLQPCWPWVTMSFGPKSVQNNWIFGSLSKRLIRRFVRQIKPQRNFHSSATKKVPITLLLQKTNVIGFILQWQLYMLYRRSFSLILVCTRLVQPYGSQNLKFIKHEIWYYIINKLKKCIYYVVTLPMLVAKTLYNEILQEFLSTRIHKLVFWKEHEYYKKRTLHELIWTINNQSLSRIF